MEKPNHDEHKIELNKLFARLHTSEHGIATEESKKRQKIYGENILSGKKRFSVLGRFLKQFTNFFAVLLMIGAGLAFFSDYLSPEQGNLYIGIALASVVFLNAIFTFVQEYQSEKIMESFKKMLPDIIEVERDGTRKEVSAKSLVPGDIIYLDEGSKIPADARLIEQNSMKVDHSSITGEAEPQLRSLACTNDNILESRNMVFSGTLVQSGNGKALVYATGMNTQIGHIVNMTKSSHAVETPLHKKLNHFIRIISIIAMILGISFFIVSHLLGKPLIGSLIFAIGIIVANVPEGLLPTVTLSLSIASKRMAKKNALIKNLESVETLGSTTVICTDKTGTLTQNLMEVTTLVLDGEEVDAYQHDLKNYSSLHLASKIMALCNNAHKGNKSGMGDVDNKGDIVYLGDPTETALLRFADRFEDTTALLQAEPRIREYPFDSGTKRMITTNRVGKESFDYIKGAPEVVLNVCDKILIKTKEKPLTSKLKDSILAQYNRLASNGKRVLGLGYKKSDDNKFVFVGLLGMVDPPRPEVADALVQCRTAGIRVIMITGDFSLTAEAIAKKVGLVDGGPVNIITGTQLESMDERQLELELDKPNLLFARTAPAHKMRIVRALQRKGEVVTVTGDGVNDAPALKTADMGVAMGKIGTEVAREASDMVLLDDNFATIVSAVEEGRTIFENIKKFVAYILTSNIPEILPFIAFVIMGIPLPLTVVLILAIDLGTDIVPALGLGTELPESDIMKKKPRLRTERLLTPQLLFMSYGVVGIIEAVAGFFSFFFVLFKGGWTWGSKLAITHPLYMKAVTAFFASIIICQIADVLICRTRRQSLFKVGISSNDFVVLGIITELILLTIIVYMPWAQPFFGTAPLTWLEISLSVPFALLILFGDEFRKWLLRRDNQFVKTYMNR